MVCEEQMKTGKSNWNTNWFQNTSFITPRLWDSRWYSSLSDRFLGPKLEVWTTWTSASLWSPSVLPQTWQETCWVQSGLHLSCPQGLIRRSSSLSLGDINISWIERRTEGGRHFVFITLERGRFVSADRIRTFSSFRILRGTMPLPQSLFKL